jgi:membrane dipeptidase
MTATALKSESITLRTRELYDKALVWDSHSGFMPDLAADLNNLQIWRDAGVNYLSIDVGFDLLPWERTVSVIAYFRHWILAHRDQFALVGNVDEIHRAKAQGKLAITFDIEGMNALDGRIEMVEFYHRLGARQILFAYNRNNQAGGGCHDENVGLTDFGRAVIDEMNRLGMFVDVSHCSHRTSMEAMEYSNRPVIFSHANARALCDHQRNIRDDQIKACAATGGVIGVVGLDLFMGTKGIDLQVMADHVDYLLDKAGPRHVGIGLDYPFPVNNSDINQLVTANPRFWPHSSGYNSPDLHFVTPGQLLELTDILLRRGHSDDIVRGVLGENFARLAAAVWK